MWIAIFVVLFSVVGLVFLGMYRKLRNNAVAEGEEPSYDDDDDELLSVLISLDIL